jgi:hypothetical protein
VLTAAQHGTRVAATAAEPPLVVLVSVTERVDADAALVAAAMAVANRVFTKAGVRVAYKTAAEVCARGPAVATTFHLMVTTAPTGNRYALGAADIPTGTAWAFLDNIRLTTAATGSDDAVILGHVIAHELGHLALESPHHAVSGLMSDPLDLERAAQGTLGFHVHEVRRMTRRLASFRAQCEPL